jgi:hypothetical protein
MENKELDSIFPELGHEVFEEKIRKPLEFICMLIAMLLV